MAIFNMFFLYDEDHLAEFLSIFNSSNSSSPDTSDPTLWYIQNNYFFLPYFIYSCILGLISCSVFLRINHELKMAVMLVAMVAYNIILLHTHGSVLDDYSKFLYTMAHLKRPGILKDLKTMGSVSLFIFFVTLLVLSRQKHCEPVSCENFSKEYLSEQRKEVPAMQSY
uniref:Uncharacterized protein n=1 Tax=Sphaerodactylus townsendi TaxID=933632 RepID=A0ACB8EBN8_9SAUR